MVLIRRGLADGHDIAFHTALDVQGGDDANNDSCETDNNGKEMDANQPNATPLSTVLNLCNNLVGAGLLTLPYCLQNASIVVGLCLLLFVGVLSAASFTLIAALCDATGQFTFRGLCEATLGRRSAVLIQIIIAVYTTVSCLSYLILCADFVAGDKGIAKWICGPATGPLPTTPPSASGSTSQTSEVLFSPDYCGNAFAEPFTEREHVLVFVSIFILLPLCLQRTLSALQFTSSISFIGMTYVAILMVVHFVSNLSSDTPFEIASAHSSDNGTGAAATVATAMWKRRATVSNVAVKAINDVGQSVGLGGPGGANLFRLNRGIFTAAPIMNVAFIAQYNAPRYYEELKDRSVWRYGACVCVAFTICFVVYVVTALFGYLSFGEATASNVLLNFERDDVAAQVARVAMTCVVLFTYPLAFHSLRSSVLSLHTQYKQKKQQGVLEGGHTGTDAQVEFILPTVVCPSELELGGEEEEEGEGDDVNVDASLMNVSAVSSLKHSRVVVGTWNAIMRQTDAFTVSTMILMVITITPAMFLTDIGIVLDYKGALLGGFIAYGLPGLMFLSLRSKNNRWSSKGGWLRLSRHEYAIPTTPNHTNNNNNNGNNMNSNNNNNNFDFVDDDVTSRLPLSPNSTSSINDEGVSAGTGATSTEHIHTVLETEATTTAVECKSGLSGWPADRVARVTVLSYGFLCFAIVTGVMGIVVTTIKVMNGEH